MMRVSIQALRRIDPNSASTSSLATEAEPAGNGWTRSHKGIQETCPKKLAAVIFSSNRKRVQHETAA